MKQVAQSPSTRTSDSESARHADQRIAGLLVPVFALRRRGDLGIGDTAAVKEAISFCARHGFRMLQILPIQETIGDHSPYNPISAHALSPALLTMDPSTVPGLDAAMLAAAVPDDWRSQLQQGLVKHDSVLALKLQLLLAAHHAFTAQARADDPLMLAFSHFQEQEASWIRPYALFRLLVREYEGNPRWSEWRPQHQDPQESERWLAVHPQRAYLEALRNGYAFIQWVAQRQWKTSAPRPTGRAFSSWAKCRLASRGRRSTSGRIVTFSTASGISARGR